MRSRDNASYATRRDGNEKRNAAKTAGALAKPKAFPMQAEGRFAHFFAREKVGRVGTRNTLISLLRRQLPPQGGSLWGAPPENPRVNQPRLRGRARQTPPKDAGPATRFREEEEAQRNERSGLLAGR